MDKAYRVLQLTCGTIRLPKELVVENVKLGVLLRLSQVGALIYIIYVLSGAKEVVEPIPFQLSVWTEGVSLAGFPTNPTHCTDLHGSATDSYSYEYPGYSSKPDRCVTVPDGESFFRGTKHMSFATHAKDEYVHDQSGTSCGTATQSACTAERSGSGYTSRYETTTAGCKCTRTVEFFYKYAEKRRFIFNHGFTVRGTDLADSSFRWSSSSTADKTTKHEKTDSKELDHSILTIIQSSEGVECSVGEGWSRGGNSHAQSKWEPSDAKYGIGGTLEEWLRCGGFPNGLDQTTPAMRVDGDNRAPSIRLTGGSVTLELNYEGPGVHNVPKHDGTVCYVRVRADAAWTGGNSMAYSSPFDVMTGLGWYRSRQTHEVTVSTTTTGKFKFWDRQLFMTAIVSSIVLLGAPASLIALVALYCIGLPSKIYAAAQAEVFNIPRRLNSVVTRVLLDVNGFKGLSKDVSCDGDVPKPLKEEVLAKHLELAMSRVSTEETSLTKEEVDHLANVFVRAVGEEGTGVSMHGFLSVAEQEQALQLDDICKLFDEDRKPCITERLMSSPELLAMERREAVIRETRRTNSNSDAEAQAIGNGKEKMLSATE